MKNRVIKIFLCCLLCGFCFLSIGCHTSTQDLYNYGLNMIAFMDKLVKSDEYVNLGIGYNVDDFIANDYDTPTDVYKISYPSNEELIKYSSNYNKIENLPEDIKNYIIQKYNFSDSLLEIIVKNCSENDIDVILSCCYETHIDEAIGERIALLYIFETGVPVLVIFDPDKKDINVSSYFMPIDEIKTLSGARTIFEPFGCIIDKYI